VKIENIVESINNNRVRITDHADEESAADELTSAGSIGEKGNRKMMPFSKCPVCGGDLMEKEVEKLLRGGVHTAVLTVRAEVCLHCGERLYPQETIKQFERIRAKLERQDLANLIPVGQSFQVME
jgi:YgiT-type zinc finger domain-containing protein